jgi:hypothetical protein
MWSAIDGQTFFGHIVFLPGFVPIISKLPDNLVLIQLSKYPLNQDQRFFQLVILVSLPQPYRIAQISHHYFSPASTLCVHQALPIRQNLIPENQVMQNYR